MRISIQRAGAWAKLITITGSAQVAVQAIGFISGILIIRLLPTHEYALYTLANSMLGTMTLLADGGISTAVIAQGGKVWQDKEKLGAVLATGLHLRRKFAVFSLIFASPILFYLLRKHDASWLMSVLTVLSIIPAFIASMSGSLLEIAPKLNQAIKQMQKIQVAANTIRLSLLVFILFIYPFAVLAILCSGVSQVWSNRRLKKMSNRYVDSVQKVDPAIEAKIFDTLKRNMPGAIYYCVSGQLTVWLISYYGTTQSLAEIGALGRMTMLLNLIGVLIAILIVPRFARLSGTKKLLITRYMQIQSILVIWVGAVMIAVWFCPDYILLLLGKEYVNLTIELILMMFAGCLGLLSGTVYSLNGVRNHIFPPMILYSLLISAQILFLISYKVDTVMMAAYYSIAMQSMAYFAHLFYGLFSLAKENSERST